MENVRREFLFGEVETASIKFIKKINDSNYLTRCMDMFGKSIQLSLSIFKTTFCMNFGLIYQKDTDDHNWNTSK